MEKSRKQINSTVVANIVKMLTKRGVMDGDLDNNIEKYSTIPDSGEITIKTANEKIYVKLVNSVISAINKTSGINDFLTAHGSSHCIIVVIDAQKKARVDLRSRYPRAELFVETDLLTDILSHDTQPEMRLLTNEEKEEFSREYNCPAARNIAKMQISDPVARYFNASRGDVVLILRPSPESGLVSYYRVIV